MIVAVMIIETEFVLRCKQWHYEWSLWLWLLRLSLYRGVNSEVMNDRRGHDCLDWVCFPPCYYFCQNPHLLSQYVSQGEGSRGFIWLVYQDYTKRTPNVLFRWSFSLVERALETKLNEHLLRLSFKSHRFIANLTPVVSRGRVQRITDSLAITNGSTFVGQMA